MRRLGGGSAFLLGAWQRLACLSLGGLVLVFLPIISALADEESLPLQVQKFVQNRLQSGAATVDVRVLPPDFGGWPAVCREPGMTFPSGEHLQARSPVSVRCAANSPTEPGWTGIVPVEVTLETDYCVLRRSMSRDAVLGEDDLEERHGKVTYLDVVTHKMDGLGKALRQPVAAGQVLRLPWLREVYRVRQGQPVQVDVQGDGFRISTDGVVMEDAPVGGVVRVRTATGKFLTGKVLANGVVQVTP